MNIAVGLSGGVDSAVAALLLQRAGHRVTGVTMKLWPDDTPLRGGPRDACFGPGEAADIAAAEALAARLDIPYRVFDLSADYARTVLSAYRSDRLSGRTPNPCIACNRALKFGLLPRLATETLGCTHFATGHYARLASPSPGRLAVARAADPRKDQSYFLWALDQAQLARALFPLGDLTKTEVRRIAAEANLPMAAKPDSQDFYSGDPLELLGTPDRPGDIVSTDGRLLGRHRGHWHYTVGQRQGLGIAAGEPLYVVRIHPCSNTVVVGRRDEAATCTIPLHSVNWQAHPPTPDPVTGLLKIRSTGAPTIPATYTSGILRTAQPVFGVAPGQSAVLYSPLGPILLGGTIA